MGDVITWRALAAIAACANAIGEEGSRRGLRPGGRRGKPMRMRTLFKQRLLFGSLIVSSAISACGVFRSSDDEAPIAPATSTPTDPTAPAAPLGTAVGTAEPGRPPPAAPVTPSIKPDGGADAASTADGGKGDAGTSGDGGTSGDAGSTSARLKACAEKCQAVMQSCLTPSFTDSGVPQIKDLAACQAAAKACRDGCAP